MNLNFQGAFQYLVLHLLPYYLNKCLLMNTMQFQQYIDFDDLNLFQRQKKKKIIFIKIKDANYIFFFFVIMNQKELTVSMNLLQA
jgi:hypothetical protein